MVGPAWATQIESSHPSLNRDVGHPSQGREPVHRPTLSSRPYRSTLHEPLAHSNRVPGGFRIEEAQFVEFLLTRGSLWIVRS